MPVHPPRERVGSALHRRLLPLYIAAFLQGFMLWPPIEKLFMTEIGFDAAAVGVMAAVYAAVVPLVEVPSGILADRWSRRGVLVVAGSALAMCALLGGLSDSVPAYTLSAVALGVYFAMYSGTMDAVVYDTVLEETGSSAEFEQRLGRIRLIEATALVSSSLLGGVLAGLAGTRVTYFLTIPFAVLSIGAFLFFREPQLHHAAERTALRTHLVVTVQAVTGRGRMLPIIILAVLSALVLQLMFEFGPLWLVALAAPAVLYGPYWAGLVSSSGVAGLLAGRLRLERPATACAMAALMVLTSVAATISTSVLVVTATQIALCVLVVTTSIHLTRLLHDGVPSAVRTGVASGVGAITWMVFLPVALGFGLLTAAHGVHAAGWTFTAITGLAGALLVRLSLRPTAEPIATVPAHRPSNPARP